MINGLGFALMTNHRIVFMWRWLFGTLFDLLFERLCQHARDIHALNEFIATSSAAVCKTASDAIGNVMGNAMGGTVKSTSIVMYILFSQYRDAILVFMRQCHAYVSISRDDPRLTELMWNGLVANPDVRSQYVIRIFLSLINDPVHYALIMQRSETHVINSIQDTMNASFRTADIGRVIISFLIDPDTRTAIRWEPEDIRAIFDFV
jgi:hypothetical protein